jgi:peroxiredoxin
MRLGLMMVVLGMTNVAHAQRPEKLLQLGEMAPAWEALPDVEQKPHALLDYAPHDVLVVVFTCNSCPYAVEYEDRLIAFAKQQCGPGKPVALIAINANQVPEDAPEKMKQRAQQKGFPFPYLYDATQQVARNHGALYTPECFVFNKERKLVYRGAFDDSPNAAEVKTHYVASAVQATLAGKQPEPAETAAIGCAVRYVRARRAK